MLSDTSNENDNRLTWFDDKKVYTTSQVVQILNSAGVPVTSRTIYRWANNGDIKHVTTNTNTKYKWWLFSGADLNEFFVKVRGKKVNN